MVVVVFFVGTDHNDVVGVAVRLLIVWKLVHGLAELFNTYRVAKVGRRIIVFGQGSVYNAASNA